MSRQATTFDAPDAREKEAIAYGPQNRPIDVSRIAAALRDQYEAARLVRRGVCLINAGQFEDAVDAFSRARNLGCDDASLSALLAACLHSLNKPFDAVEQFHRAADGADAGVVQRIRYALALRRIGDAPAAVQALRDALRVNPEESELHFQLGLLLTDMNQLDEAELRFTQAVNIDDRHVEALVNLALCLGVRGFPESALKNLRRAQTLRPHDARIGLLLAQSARAVSQSGRVIRFQAAMPAESEALSRDSVEQLSRVIEQEPDFVDAFLSLPSAAVDQPVYLALLRTIEFALERQPEHAELYFHCGRVLERLGRRDAAIKANEQAISLNPRYIRALIELAKLYQQTDRSSDAAARLEEAIAAGGEYADVYCLLGDLYRDQGQIPRARDAYEHAIRINQRLQNAHDALATLPA